jgi:bifunctional DNA primase/polymerase-like protein
MTGLSYLRVYADAGIALLPLLDRAKEPRTKHGKDDATTDLAQIDAWRRRWPSCNWGGRPPVGQFVLDVDPRNGGLDTLGQLEEEHGLLPKTRTARTGSGGLHLWYAWSGPVLGRLGAGLDIKSNTGYLVLPPSIHPSGGAYEWIDRSPVAPAPQWMGEQLTPRPRAVNAGDRPGNISGLVRAVLTAEQGERNQRLLWAACRAAEEGLDPEPLRQAAQLVGLDPRETDRTITSAARTVARQIGV